MNILIIGSGGREHALAEIYSKSKRVNKVFVVPGNGLTDFQNEKIITYPSIDILDFDEIVKLCKKEKIDLVDVAPDPALAAGFIDRFQRLGIKAFGPTQKAAEIEWSKEWSRNFMIKYHLPIPEFKSFSDEKKAINYVKNLYRHPEPASPSQGGRTRSQVPDGTWRRISSDSSSGKAKTQNDKLTLYIKASGLALGKGAIRAENRDEAIEAIKSMKQFGKSGETFLIEECLIGEEFSLFALCDGKSYKIVGFAQDHKTAYDNDKGPNTGGMGCVAPIKLITSSIIRIVEQKILQPFMKGMQKEGRLYTGVLYFGGIVTHSASHSTVSSDRIGSGQASKGLKVIEFNARWGDPEAEVILPSIQTDYLLIVESILSGKLKSTKILQDKKVRVSVAGCSKGYPKDYSKVKGKEIFGLDKAQKIRGVNIYGAGITRKGNRFFAHGGRVFHLIAEGKNILDARKKAYNAIKLISIDGDNLHYRTDIGWRDVERMRNPEYNRRVKRIIKK